MFSKILYSVPERISLCSRRIGGNGSCKQWLDNPERTGPY